MNKQEFLDKLRTALQRLPKEEIEERLSFYSEMIDDRIEEGITEQEAVKEIGNIEDILAQTVVEPISEKVEKQTTQKKKLKGWEIALIALGCPLWIPLVVAFVAVVFSFYVVVWCIDVCLWAVFASLISCGFGGIVSGIILICNSNVLSGVALIGAGIVCIGLSIFVFFGCKFATKGVITLTKLLFKKCKKGEKTK